MNPKIRAAENELQLADTEWMRLLRERYPHGHLGDIRYTAEGRGEPGSALRAACDRFRDASTAYQLAWAEHRGELKSGGA